MPRRTTRSIPVPLVAAALIVTASVCAQTTTVQPPARGPGGIVAIINQEFITRPQLDHQFEMRSQQLVRIQGVPASEIERRRPEIEHGILDALIEQELLLQDAKKNDVTVSEEEVDLEVTRRIEKEFRPSGVNVQDSEELYRFLKETLKMSRDEYRGQVKKEVTVLRLLWRQYFREPFISPGEIREYYRAHPDEFELPATVAFRMISIERSEEALRVMEQIDGALKTRSFKDVADEWAQAHGEKEAPVYRKNLEELRDWKAPLPSLLSRGKPGEVIPRINVGNGWRYLEIVEKTPGERRPFEQSQAQIVGSIRKEFNETQRQKLMERLYKGADVQKFLPALPAAVGKGASDEEKAAPEESKGKVRDASPDPAEKKKPTEPEKGR